MVFLQAEHVKRSVEGGGLLFVTTGAAVTGGGVIITAFPSPWMGHVHLIILPLSLAVLVCAVVNPLHD